MHINEYIIDYLEGSLHHSVNNQVKEHLQTCNRCISLLKAYKDTYGLIIHEREFEYKPFFYTRLRAKMESEEVEDNFFMISLKKTLFPLSIAVSVIIGVFVGNEEKDIQSERILVIKELSEELLPVDYNEFVYLVSESND